MNVFRIVKNDKLYFSFKTYLSVFQQKNSSTTTTVLNQNKKLNEFIKKYSNTLKILSKSTKELTDKDTSIIYLYEIFQGFKSLIQKRGKLEQETLLNWRNEVFYGEYKELSLVLKYINENNNYKALTSSLLDNIDNFKELIAQEKAKIDTNLEEARRL